MQLRINPAPFGSGKKAKKPFTQSCKTRCGKSEMVKTLIFGRNLGFQIRHLPYKFTDNLHRGIGDPKCVAEFNQSPHQQLGFPTSSKQLHPIHYTTNQPNLPISIGSTGTTNMECHNLWKIYSQINVPHSMPKTSDIQYHRNPTKKFQYLMSTQRPSHSLVLHLEMPI